MNLEKRALKLLQSKKQTDIDMGFEYFFEKYSKLAFVCIYNITKNKEDSKDLVSDTFFSFFNKRDKLDKEKNIKYYMFMAQVKYPNLTMFLKVVNNQLKKYVFKMDLNQLKIIL